MATSKFHQFVARVKDTGLAKSAHFYVEFTPPRSMYPDQYTLETINLYCQSAQIPDMALQTSPIQEDGLERQVVINKSYGRATFEFVCDQDMMVRSFFEEWIKRAVVSKRMGDRIVPTGGVFAYPKEYTVDSISVHQVNMARETVYTNTMYDCFPIVLGSMPLSHASPNALHVVQVQFTYRYWDSMGTYSSMQAVPEDIRGFMSGMQGSYSILPQIPQAREKNTVVNNPTNIFETIVN